MLLVIHGGVYKFIPAHSVHSTHKHYIGDLSRFVQAALVESVTVSPCVENSQINIYRLWHAVDIYGRN